MRSTTFELSGRKPPGDDLEIDRRRTMMADSSADLIFLKLGGSLLTDKTDVEALRRFLLKPL